MTQVKNFHIFVEGRVQGVGYRRYAHQKARALGLKGWARNLLDGRVELQVTVPVEVSPAQEKAFFEDLRRGPAFAKVRDLKITPIDKHHANDFEIWPDEELGGK